MTLIVAINLVDYIFLVGDHRLIITCEPFTGLPEKTIVDDYKKIQYWKYGAITVSGDVILMDYFHRVLELYANKNNWNFLEMAQVTRTMFLDSGRPIEHAKGTAFFSIFTAKKVELISLAIRHDEIEFETIPEMNAHFSLFAGTPDDPIYQVFVNSMRKTDKFITQHDFFNYHISLLKQFYTRQKAFDASITSSFDLFIQDRKTGAAITTTIQNY